jgi:hypothetical protein
LVNSALLFNSTRRGEALFIPCKNPMMVRLVSYAKASIYNPKAYIQFSTSFYPDFVTKHQHTLSPENKSRPEKINHVQGKQKMSMKPSMIRVFAWSHVRLLLFE